MSSAGSGSAGINLLVFEIGMVITDPITGTETVLTVSVHPLLVVPTSIQWQDNTRSALTETTGGSLKTGAGRALRTCNLAGSFGVESRGLGPYIGNGDVRFQRFYKEVVRMSDALDSDALNAAVDVINGTPFISLLVKPYVPDQTVFFINFYDFWNDISVQALLQSFNWTLAHRNAGATGLRSYTTQIREVGPVKAGGLGNTIISGLLDVLGTWGAINDLIDSTTITDILDAQTGVLSIGASELGDTAVALTDQAKSVTQLLGGTSATSLATSASLSGVTTFLQNAKALGAGLLAEMNAINQRLNGGEFDNDTGSIDPSTVVGEGGNDHLGTFESLTSLGDILDAAAFQVSAGVYFGMSRPDYAAFIESGGTVSFTGSDIEGAISHFVSSTDTPESIELAYGTAWSDIVAANALTPDEALLPGTELRIPTLRPRGAPGLHGLPTFASHQGTSAWGIDLAMEFDLDASGYPTLVAENDVLIQGMQFLIEAQGEDILKAVNSVPPVAQTKYISQRLQAMFKSDQRIVGVDSLDVVVDPAGGYDVDVTLFAMNGGTIRTGALRA